ncbi:MAG: 2-phospho-L-lactate transferase [Halobacteriaceae archaeon]
MVTFLSGGTGTPKLLSGAVSEYSPEMITVIGNTGDDIKLGGNLICPDLDTVLFERAGILDKETWWGIAEDTSYTHDQLTTLVEATSFDEPQFLPPSEQMNGDDIGRWRQFGGIPEFMYIGDRDRAIHIFRTALLEAGYTLTDVIQKLTEIFDISITLLPMSDDPVSSIIHTESGQMHFQEFWVDKNGKPNVEDVEFRGGKSAETTDQVLTAIRNNPVIIGPSNPITSIGPMLELDALRDALYDTDVVAVSPFIEDTVFSGPAAKLMEAEGYQSSTTGVAQVYSFVDAFVLDVKDSTSLDRPIVRTETEINTHENRIRVIQACKQAFKKI